MPAIGIEEWLPEEGIYPGHKYNFPAGSSGDMGNKWM